MNNFFKIFLLMIIFNIQFIFTIKTNEKLKKHNLKSNIKDLDIQSIIDKSKEIKDLKENENEREKLEESVNSLLEELEN